MIKLRFEPSGHEVAVEPPMAIVDITDTEPEADVPYSCRSASCGTCRVWVLEGGDALSPPEQDELDVLDMFDDDPAKVRLCCQAKVVASATERVVLKVHDG